MQTFSDGRRVRVGAYFFAILLPSAVLWALALAAALIDPATVCNPPEAMCCYICGIFGLLTFIPVVGYMLAALIFAPGILVAAIIAHMIAGWRPFYWIAGWIVAGILATIPVALFDTMQRGQTIAFNLVALSILTDEYRGLALVLGFFGLLCGIGYWAMLVKSRWSTV